MISVRKTARAWLAEMTLPPLARAIRRADRTGVPSFDPGAERIIDEGLAWLCRAQDSTASRDGGVARHFDVAKGEWATSYPETTGYIAETFIRLACERSDENLLQRARTMLDWLVSIQFPDGAFQGGMIHEVPHVPATFDTGQILIGLAAGVVIDERYRAPMIRAADWLVKNQGPDGSWRKYETSFAAAGEKTYETHVSIGLFRTHAVEPARGYLDAASKQVDWALTQQKASGWFANCCLTDQLNPLTHTIGYALRGIIEAFLATREQRYLESASRAAESIMSVIGPDGRLAGRLTENWKPAAPWVCLTGSAQIAECLFLLSQTTGRDRYLEAARRASAYVRRTMSIDGLGEIRGGVKGSFPIDGRYGQWQYLNWACKFMIDANCAELNSQTTRSNNSGGTRVSFNGKARSIR